MVAQETALIAIELLMCLLTYGEPGRAMQSCEAHARDQRGMPDLAMLVMRRPSCSEVRWESSASSSLAAVSLTAAFSPSGTRDHSREPSVLRQELPTAFLAMTAATTRIACERQGSLLQSAACARPLCVSCHRSSQGMVMRPVTWYRRAYVNTAVQHQVLAQMNALTLLHNMHGNLNVHVAFLLDFSPAQVLQQGQGAS